LYLSDILGVRVTDNYVDYFAWFEILFHFYHLTLVRIIIIMPLEWLNMYMDWRRTVGTGPSVQF
jgi:hypothetical protein